MESCGALEEVVEEEFPETNSDLNEYLLRELEDRSDPGYAECKRKAGQVQSVDGKEVFIETEPVKKSIFDDVFGEVFSSKEVVIPGGKTKADLKFDFDSSKVKTGGGLGAYVLSLGKATIDAFSFETEVGLRFRI